MTHDIEMLGLLEPLDEEEMFNSAALVERNIKSGWTDLPEIDRAFAVEYMCNGFKHCEAAEAVGLKRSSGLRKLRAPLVQGFITYLNDQRIKARLITQEFVEAKYIELLPKLLGEEEVPLVSPQGESYTAKKFHSGEAVSVLRDLGKAAGYVPEETGNKASVNVTINMGSLYGEEREIETIIEDKNGEQINFIPAKAKESGNRD